MTAKKITTSKGEITKIKNIENTLTSASDVVELYLNTNSETIVIDQSELPQNFFDLKTKIAGDILQKISNYNKRLVILISFSSTTSNSLHDFIYESNKTGKVVFTDSIDKAITLLK
jgi:hypothetical protein